MQKGPLYFQEKLVQFILACQDEETGGFADRPGDIVSMTGFILASGHFLFVKRNFRWSCDQMNWLLTRQWTNNPLNRQLFRIRGRRTMGSLICHFATTIFHTIPIS